MYVCKLNKHKFGFADKFTCVAMCVCLPVYI